MERADIVLIDEIDVQLFENPQGLFSLLQSRVHVVGFSASLLFSEDGSAKYFVTKVGVKIFTIEIPYEAK